MDKIKIILDWINIVIVCLNENNGVITAFATVVLVVITFWYASTTQKILKASNKPVILVYLFPSEGYTSKINLCIQNIGTGFASNIKIKGDYSTLPTASLIHNPFQEMSIFKDGIDYLGPGRKIEIPLFFTHSMGELKEKSLDLSVEYNDSNGTSIPHTFQLDFKKWIDFHQEENPIVSASDSLKTIALEIHRVLKYPS